MTQKPGQLDERKGFVAFKKTTLDFDPRPTQMVYNCYPSDADGGNPLAPLLEISDKMRDLTEAR